MSPNDILASGEGRLGKSRLGKNAALDGIAWHRWLLPLQGAMDRFQAPLDRAAIEAELATHESGKTPVPRPELLGCLRRHLDQAKANLRTAFYDSNDGAIYVGMHAWTIDILLQSLYAQAQRYCAGGDEVALIAVGGYGRGEMAPFSDVDIMFLMPKKPTAKHMKFIEFVLYILWDLGLKIGHSTRSIDESIEAASEDQTVLTSLLEMRHVAGDDS
ncbi:MAG: nucleotidyltransferase domain-containing protein, partial [Candidatus Puniceispirillaceae bacterium]